MLRSTGELHVYDERKLDISRILSKFAIKRCPEKYASFADDANGNLKKRREIAARLDADCIRLHIFIHFRRLREFSGR